MRLPVLIAAAAALITLGGAASARPAGPIAALGAVIRPAPKGLPSTAAYLTLTNAGDRPVVLTGARCACAEMVMAHRSFAEGGVMHMAPAQPVIPAHGRLSFAPGALHLMLTGLKRPIAPGDRVPLTLTFDHAPPLDVAFTARR